MSDRPMLAGKTVIVTGAGRGIGREIALLCARHGANLVVNDVGATGSGEGSDATPAAEVVGEIAALGGKAVESRHDVSQWAQGRDVVGAAMEAFGRIDAVVNNAGILRDVIFHRMEESDWDAVIAVNLKGAFNVSRAAMPHFRKQAGGALLHMTSASGLIGNLGQANYAAAKAGLLGLSKAIALDGARFGVRSNCIMPFAWSRLTGTIPGDGEAERARVDRLKRMSPATIAPMAVFLASDAAREVSGQVFAVRMNEIFLLSQPRPLRSVHEGGGWTPESIAEHAIPALRSSFYPLDRSADVFSWDPI